MTTLELLDAEKIRAHLNNNAQRYLATLEILTEIGSTNSYLLNKPNLPNGYVCLAEQQTAGRGRHNKPWHSPFGKNICLSIAWHFSEIKQITGLSIAVGVAVANTLVNYGLPSIDLKWPNDVWYQRKKLCGILVEINKENNNNCYRAVIGVGINVDNPKGENIIDQPWIDIATITQQTPKRNLLVSFLLNELFNTLVIFQTQGLTSFLPQWQQYDILLNKPITVFYQHEQLTGVAVGIDQNGNLLVDFNGVIKPVFSGEVSVRF
jgi:BirA family biotin operon repressor/biotin-[acetyl-CoA-carboxylase] ligase